MLYLLIFLLSVIKGHNISLTISKLMKSTDIVSYIETSLMTPLHMGTPKQTLLLLITNVDFNTIFISSRLFNESLSSSFDNLNNSLLITAKNKTLSGTFVSDNVYFKGFEVDDFNFILLKRKSTLNINDGVLGLDLGSSNSNLSDISIFEQLKRKGLISYKTFGLSFDKETEVGTLILGIRPPTTKQEQSKYQWCNIPEGINAWICQLENQNLGINIDTATRVLFKIDYSFISAPAIYFQYIIEVYLQRAIQEKLCKIMVSIKDKVKWIECKKELKLTSFEPFVFTVNTMNFILQPKDLFITLPFHNDTMVFGIVLDKKREEFDWIFGDIALNQYSLIFDIENRVIMFSNQFIIENNSKGERIIIICIYGVIAILIPLSIAIYSRVRNKRKKAFQMKNEWKAFMKLESFNLQM